MRLEVRLWFNEITGHIHIASRQGEPFISTVSADPAAPNGNPHLYLKLARCLRAAALPAPDLPSHDETES